MHSPPIAHRRLIALSLRTRGTCGSGSSKGGSRSAARSTSTKRGYRAIRPGSRINVDRSISQHHSQSGEKGRQEKTNREGEKGTWGNNSLSLFSLLSGLNDKKQLEIEKVVTSLPLEFRGSDHVRNLVSFTTLPTSLPFLTRHRLCGRRSKW